MQPDLSACGRFRFDNSQHRDAAVWMWSRVEDLANALAASHLEEGIAGIRHRISIQMRKVRASFQFAPVFNAGDDFLTWKAAFLKAERAQSMKIEHLGQEGF